MTLSLFVLERARTPKWDCGVVTPSPLKYEFNRSVLVERDALCAHEANHLAGRPSSPRVQASERPKRACDDPTSSATPARLKAHRALKRLREFDPRRDLLKLLSADRYSAGLSCQELKLGGEGSRRIPQEALWWLSA